ncbi:MAG: serine hydrolase domain-containing protein [Pseudomonadota bacterium]
MGTCRKMLAGLAAISTIGPAAAGDADRIRMALMDTDARIVAAIRQEEGAAASLDVEVGRGLGTGQVAPLVDLGSLTKFVTAVAVLHLVDAGRLSLDARLADLLPGVPEDKAAISVHQLLTHMGGFAESTGADPERLDRTGFLRRVMARPLEQAPGSGYLYSNAGYSLLAAIVETVSGWDYERYLLDDLLEPNGLPPIGYAAVYAPDRSIRTARTLSTAFRRAPIQEASWGAAAPGWNLIGNGGLVTTAEGFLAFWDAFLSGRLVSDELVALALTPFADEGGGESHYGYGLVVETSPKHGTIYWHDGGNDRFSSEWRHVADRGLSIFVAGIDDDAFDAMEAALRQLD